MNQKPIYIGICAVLAAFAVGRIVAVPVMEKELIDEKGLHDILPTEAGGATLVRGTESHPNVTYRMDDKTYEELVPLGIGGQHFRDSEGRIYDVVVIAGARMESFHEQQWCFAAQGWSIPKQGQYRVNTSGYGPIDMWLMTIQQPSRQPLHAAYTFMTPRAFRTDFSQGQRDFLLKAVTTLKPHVGYSFRFIALDPSTPQEDFTAFVVSYMDQISKVIPKPTP
ncbi:MAG: hypothetical protein MUC92_12145 [Fimbriimonadaceae bacterium]|jgi:hypothetical protein|nr:hypothetical protein [Fimbriimonadaceae bacterium]